MKIFQKNLVISIIASLLVLMFAQTVLGANNKPQISQLRANSTVFSPVAPQPEKIALTYKLSENAKITLKISGGAYNKKVILQNLNAKKGSNTLNWNGYIGKEIVKEGTYKLILIAVDTAHNSSVENIIWIKVDGVQEKTKRAVAVLFKDNKKAVLNSGLNQQGVDKAYALVDTLPEGNLKIQLTADLDKFTQLVAEDAVSQLFANKNKTALAAKVTQANIDNALDIVALLPEESELKDILSDDIRKAQELLDSEAAKNQVAKLFADNGKLLLVKGVNQDTIDAAYQLIDALPAGTVKDTLESDVEKAQQIFTNNLNLGEAKNAVSNLFTDNNKAILRPGLTQAEIDDAQALIDELGEGPDKVQLQNDLNKAKELLKS